MADYDLLIFDWDGTLVDSVAKIVESIRVAADVCGLAQLDEAPIKGIIGLGLPEAIAVLYPDLRDVLLIERFRMAYAEHYLALEAAPSALFPGVAEGLEAFRQAGYRMAVATGKTRRGLQRVLEGRGWADYFEATRCADETASKPDPLMLREILTQCGVSPRRALMIGDSCFDLQMARNAGVDAVGVGYGAQSLESLQGFEPCLAIMEFAELHDWLLPVGARRLTEVHVYG